MNTYSDCRTFVCLTSTSPSDTISSETLTFSPPKDNNNNMKT